VLLFDFYYHHITVLFLSLEVEVIVEILKDWKFIDHSFPFYYTDFHFHFFEAEMSSERSIIMTILNIL
jgi:hypothetical protein